MTKSLARRPLPTIRTLRRLARKEDGAAAIEFGLVAFPFLLLVFAILETAFFLFAGQTLETAVTDTGRLIMTGQAQQQELNQTTFKDAVCARLQGGLFDCQAAVYIDVQTMPTFDFNRELPPLDADGKFQTSFQPGGPGDIVLVRAFHQWPIYVSWGLLTGNTRLLVATAAFRNEPFNPVAAAAN
ncbi:MAG: pilus assembly protein [Rhizobiales bacterium]|nr:pilus assembly protein [Hyphomicrobiales bacterium]